jgi:thiol:disulfide interchange protein DsbD
MNPSPDQLNQISAFLGGVLVSFTPCVYPLIPVSAGYITVNAAGSRLKGFILSLVYVGGIAVIYSTLGLFASLTGTIFGGINSHPATYFIYGILIILSGLSMLDLFHIKIPDIIRRPALKKGYLSVFLLGLSSGLIVSPCLTPVLGAILAYVATQKNLLYGATLLFSFAYGMGLILILTGTFGAILFSFLKPGKWMLYIKRICAALLLGAGVYFILSSIKGM